MDPRRRLLTGREAAKLCGVDAATIRSWVKRNHLSPYPLIHGKGKAHLYLEADVLEAERRTRQAGGDRG